MERIHLGIHTVHVVRAGSLVHASHVAHAVRQAILSVELISLSWRIHRVVAARITRLDALGCGKEAALT